MQGRLLNAWVIIINIFFIELSILKNSKQMFSCILTGNYDH